jgi:hypothetical protein
MPEEPTTWDNTYLLGWFDNGRPYLTSWDSHVPMAMVSCVVTGSRGNPPMWDAPVPPGAKIHPIPSDCVTQSQCELYAASIGGVYAFGWRVPVARKTK